MLYIIGGASRSGKTLLAKRILQQMRIPYLSLDWLVMGFTNGLSGLGIHDKLLPREIAERSWDFLKAMCESIIWSGDDLVIEGEALLPERISELTDRYPNRIKVCFLGYIDIDIERKTADIRTLANAGNDWLADAPDDRLHQHIENMIRHSRYIKDGCRKYHFRYIETGQDFIAAVDEAYGCIAGEK